jgi:hypothetical protein
LNYQIVLGKEEDPLKKKTLSTLEIDSESNRVPSSTDKRVDCCCVNHVSGVLHTSTSANYPLSHVLYAIMAT